MITHYEELHDIVRRYIFDDIFNYSDITLKNNVRLSLMNNGVAVRGIIYNNILTSLMPTPNHAYYLFMCSNIHINNLLGWDTDWITLEEVLATRDVNCDVITRNNRLIPKKYTYCRVSKCGMTLIAIDQRIHIKYGITPVDTYMTSNLDTSVANEKTMLSYSPGDTDFTPLTIAAASNPIHQLSAFVNGFYYKDLLFQSTGNRSTDYYELYVDKNIVFTFSVDLDVRHTYMSSEEDLYKDIVIIPRNLLGNTVMTYDTITVFVRDYAGKGLLIPYLGSTSVSQLTHGVISISSYLIDAALDKLGVVAGELYIQVANYDKTNLLIVDNGSNTEQMYTEDDAFILAAVKGNLNPNVNGWMADDLEKHEYGKCLTEMGKFDKYNVSNITSQIECLGYYNFVNLLCKHNGEIHGLSGSINSVDIEIPVFWKEADLYPIIYINGSKVDVARYTSSVIGDILRVEFSPAVTASMIQYELVLNENVRSTTITPTNTDRVVIVPKTNGSIKVFNHVSGSILSVDGVESSGYRLDDGYWHNIVDTGLAYVVTFNNLSYGLTFTVTVTDIATIQSFLNLDITSGKTIALIPATSDNKRILTDGNYEVYFNGKYMVKDVDYVLEKMSGDDNIFSGYQIVIQNLKFMNDTTPNNAEIISSSRMIHRVDVGYIVDGRIHRNDNNEAWVPGLSRLFINGRLVPVDKVTKYKTHYEIHPDWCSNGHIYCFVIGVSDDFHAAYLPYMNDDYFIHRRDISRHFTFGYQYVVSDPFVISSVNRVYSAYLNEIILRVLSGEIDAQYVSDDQIMIDRFIEYEYLKKFDVAFKDGSLVDRRYVDLYPCYLLMRSTDDFNKYMVIQRMVKILLGSDVINDSVVAYIGN